MDSAENRPGLRQKLVREAKEMLMIFLYLAGFFCAFTTYRKLALKELGVSYFHYGFALVKALVLAKVVLIGQLIRASRIVDDRPLIIPTIYKVLFFTLFVMLFEVLEHVIAGAIHGKDPAAAVQELLRTGLDELLARALMVICAFIPFFALTEIARVHGEGYILRLFFRPRTPAGPLKPEPKA